MLHWSYRNHPILSTETSGTSHASWTLQYIYIPKQSLQAKYVTISADSTHIPQTKLQIPTPAWTIACKYIDWGPVISFPFINYSYSHKYAFPLTDILLPTSWHFPGPGQSSPGLSPFLSYSTCSHPMPMVSLHSHLINQIVVTCINSY